MLKNTHLQSLPTPVATALTYNTANPFDQLREMKEFFSSSSSAG